MEIFICSLYMNKQASVYYFCLYLLYKISLMWRCGGNSLSRREHFVSNVTTSYKFAWGTGRDSGVHNVIVYLLFTTCLNVASLKRCLSMPPTIPLGPQSCCNTTIPLLIKLFWCNLLHSCWVHCRFYMLKIVVHISDHRQICKYLRIPLSHM